ncbi:MAG: YihY/virulence factor BrkB family protein [Anaerolineaceae bacterium]|nr:YihY/virulence factor BrkB family protein [Anaerolineaceae bacterium]
MFWKKFDKFSAKNTVRPFYNFLNKQLHGGLDVLRLAGQSFAKERAPEAAASVAYFTFFSLFPLILVIISFASFVLKSQFVQDQVYQFILDLIPISPDIIVNNIENVLTRRGAVGWIAIVGLVWSATTMFNIFALNVDRAWSDERSHNFLERRLIGIIIIIGLSILILVLWGMKALLDVELVQNLLTYFQIPVFQTTLYEIIAYLAPRIFRFMIFWVMYQWIPKAMVRPSEAFWGATFAIILTELITLVMNWYLNSQFVRYELIYGSLGRIIALMLWIYFSSYVILFGAHISSAVGRLFRKNIKKNQVIKDVVV